jgi:hypothetical protein
MLTIGLALHMRWPQFRLRSLLTPRPQFRLRSLFILTAIVAVGCAVGPRAFDAVRLGAARGGSLDTAVLSVAGLVYAVWGAWMMDKRPATSWSCRFVFYGAAIIVAGSLSALDAPTHERRPTKYVISCGPAYTVHQKVVTSHQKVVTRRMLSPIRRVSRQPRRPVLHGRSRRRLVQCRHAPPPPQGFPHRHLSVVHLPLKLIVKNSCVTTGSPS